MIQTWSTPFACGCPPNTNLRVYLCQSKEAGGWKQRDRKEGRREISVCELRIGGVYEKEHDENIWEKKKKRKCLPERGTGKSGRRAPGRSVEGYFGLDWSETREEDQRNRVTKTSMQQMPLPCASISRPCHGAKRLEILTQGKNILVRVVGLNTLETLASLGWSEDRQNHGYVPCFDSHLGLVLSARSLAIAFPGRLGLTRSRFSQARITPSWVPQPSASRK